MPCTAKKDTTHEHKIDIYYGEVGIPKNGHQCRTIPLGGARFAQQSDIGQISRRMIKINLTQI